jgi:hypothetical protein
MPPWPRLNTTTLCTRLEPRQQQPHHIQQPCCPPPSRPMTYMGVVLSTMGGNTRVTSLTLTPSALLLPTVNSRLRTVCQRAWPCCCTGRRHCPCTPSPPDKVLPSHPHPTLGCLPTPTKTLTTLARATSPCCSVVLSPPTSLTTPSTPSLLPFTFSNDVHLSFGGGTTHPFYAGGQDSPPQKRSRCKHPPCHAGQCHGPRASDLQEHLLCGRRHWPRAPNQSTSNEWA